MGKFGKHILLSNTHWPRRLPNFLHLSLQEVQSHPVPHVLHFIHLFHVAWQAMACFGNGAGTAIAVMVQIASVSINTVIKFFFFIIYKNTACI